MKTFGIAERAEKAGFELPGDVSERLELYAQLLVRWGSRTSLVGPEILADPVPSVIESIEPIRQLPSPATLLDVGSGGGIPALPLAIAWPVGRLRLVEPRRKRWSFLSLAIRELGLVGEVIEKRIEEMPSGPKVEALSMRGVPEPAQWLRLLRREVLEGAVGLLWSGEDRRAELGGLAEWTVTREVPLRAGGHRLYELRAFPVEQAPHRTGGMRQFPTPEGIDPE